MKKFWLLTKVQLKGGMDLKRLFHFREGKKGSSITAMIISIFLLVMFTGMSAIYAGIYADMLKPMGALHIIPSLWMAASSMILLITAISKVKGTLFSFQDYDMVMSMPVSTAAIVASRIIVLYVYELLFTIIFMLPANIVYGVHSGEGVAYYLLSSLMLLAVPFIPILAGSLVGLVITVISARFRYSNLVTLVLAIGLYVAYMLVIMKPGKSDAAMVDAAKVLTEKVNAVYPLTMMYGTAVVEKSIVDIAGFLGISTLFFVLFCLVVGKGYKKLNTWITSSKARSNYKMKELKASSVLCSLYKKEMKRYFASPMYVMNTAIGMILLTVASIVYLISGKEQFAQMIQIPGFLELIGDYVPVMLLVCTMMTCTTSSSISLEGRNLWLMKALPVLPIQVFLGKVLLNLTITMPLAAVNVILYAVTLKMSGLQIIVSLLLPFAGALFIAFFGLALNLLFPRFDWKTEMEVVKQSLPSFLTMLIGLGLGIIPGVLLHVITQMNQSVVLLLYAGGLLIITCGIYYYLKGIGSKKFQQL